MSRAGESYDNAYAESLFSRYKAELLEGGAFADVEEARLESFNYIEGYYNSSSQCSFVLCPCKCEFLLRRIRCRPSPVVVVCPVHKLLRRYGLKIAAAKDPWPVSQRMRTGEFAALDR